jgi:hypothetical protein
LAISTSFYQPLSKPSKTEYRQADEPVLNDSYLMGVVKKKIELNESKYPAEMVRGSARKYTEY